MSEIQNIEIDAGRLKVHCRRLAREELLTLLDRAVDRLPANALPALIQGIPRTKTEMLAPQPLLDSVAEFRKASLRGDYFESFEVNYKNCNQTSLGTDAWFAECLRVFGECIHSCHQEGQREARQGFDSLFELLRLVDGGDREILFFADEGGSYLLGADWNELLKAYFSCLAATATAHEYASQVVGVVDDFVGYDRNRFLAIARAVGTAEQQRALL